MRIEACIYSNNWLTYKSFYKDAIISAYLKEGITISSKDISPNLVDLPGLTIQAQRNPSSEYSRSIMVYEVDLNGTKMLKYIIGVSNTGYDEDKRSEGGKYVYGGDGFHSNTYMCQGINKIIERYYRERVKYPKVKLYFYLLDTKGKKSKSYVNSLSNILVYRLLYTIGFEIININDIDFSKWSQIESKFTHLKYSSFNKLVNDITFISRKNKRNKPSYIKSYKDEEGEEKYVYTFKVLGANSYDAFLQIWALSILAKRENKKLEFLFAPEIYNFRLGQSNVSMTTDFPGPIKRLLAVIGIDVIYDTSTEIRQQLNREIAQFETAKENKNLRNQEYFKNNLREKGLLVKCCLCGCEVDSILEAAHLWGVAEINSASDDMINEMFEICNIDYDKSIYKDDVFFKKYLLANSGDNGVWLCRNHHGLFDRNHFVFDENNGSLIMQSDTDVNEYVDSTSTVKFLPSDILTEETKVFLKYANLTRRTLRFE